MIDNIEIVGGVIAILLALYSWVKKPIEDMKTEIMVTKAEAIRHKEEIDRLRDNHHDIRGTLHIHEGRLSKLEKSV